MQNFLEVSFLFCCRLALAESELALAESKKSELGAMMTQMKEEQQTMSKIHQTELRREREVCDLQCTLISSQNHDFLCKESTIPGINEYMVSAFGFGKIVCSSRYHHSGISRLG